jgi:hypothetical protein
MCSRTSIFHPFEKIYFFPTFNSSIAKSHVKGMHSMCSLWFISSDTQKSRDGSSSLSHINFNSASGKLICELHCYHLDVCDHFLSVCRELS